MLNFIVEKGTEVLVFKGSPQNAKPHVCQRDNLFIQEEIISDPTPNHNLNTDTKNREIREFCELMSWAGYYGFQANEIDERGNLRKNNWFIFVDYENVKVFNFSVDKIQSEQYTK